MILGITSPLRIISIFAPLPIPLSSINDALYPVARWIVTPASLHGLTFTTGLRDPDFDGCQITSRTSVVALSHILSILKALAYLGFPEVFLSCFPLSWIIIPSISYSELSRNCLSNSGNFSAVIALGKNSL